MLTENQLDEWVRGNARDAQGVIVELVWRLVAASSPRPKERRFPLGDSIGQPGPDGVLDVDFSYEPFVPDGRSFWEIGTGLNAGAKATSDYKDLVEGTPAEIRYESTFVFVTPLSGRRDWQHTWKEDAQENWLKERRDRRDWRGVHVIDGTKLIDWLHQFPSVELWLAQTMGLPVQRIDTPEQRWNLLKSIGEPPPLTHHVFLANRDAACAKLKEVFAGNTVQLKIDTHFPDQVVDFVCAYVAAMEEESRIDAVARCLVICGVDAWNAITTLREPHVLIADPDLDLTGAVGTKLIQKARRAGHSVIFGGEPGGIPDPTCISIPLPKGHQIKEALEQAGYSEERARILAQKSGGNLGSLLRCLQNLSLMPEWAEGTASADLAIAALLGSWSEKSDADISIMVDVSRKSYGEWIGKVREIALRPGTPLTQRDGVWKFVSRYEGWYSLGSRLFDEHLDSLRKSAISVLRERDPKLDLPREERYAAQIHGKLLVHSRHLRNGLSESLALLGSHPKALASCSLGKPEATAMLAVREILTDADWVLWASLNDLLPLLAEAAPVAFLDAVDKALNSNSCPFDELFAQEGDGIIGTTYMSGLLWALETLAWDAEYLSRVVICLGELAARDPGGRWSNRPVNSLTTILLPWLPQTCSPIAMRCAAVATILYELPEVGWKLLLSLLPQSHSASSGSRRPAWREIIPDDWSKGVTHREYGEQVALYAELAINAAKNDLKKLSEIIDRLEDLPPPAHEQLLVHLESDTVMAMEEVDRLSLWTELIDLVTKHRKYAGAEWAMQPEQVDKIAAIAERLGPESPFFRHQRLFSERDFDLYEEKGDYESQRIELEGRRQIAVQEIASGGGFQAVLSFATLVQSAWRVGYSVGFTADNDADCTVLPNLLETEQKQLAQFAGGFVWGRFRSRGWPWVDEINTTKWESAQIGQFLAYLPFTPDTWERSSRLLGVDEATYWTKTSANPYEAENGIEHAVSQLIDHERPYAAIRCLHKMKFDKQPLDNALAVRALLAAIVSSEGANSTDTYEIIEIIQTLQNDPETNPDDLFRIEWAYLKLLDRDQSASPKLLEHWLATRPEFFCEVLRIVFISKKQDCPVEEASEEKKNIATNAYRLLTDWQTPPGIREDGSYDGDALLSWLEDVKKECTETGHLEVAMTMVGHVLAHTPSDPDGLWIHRAAASVLNEKDAADMRNGFRTEMFNSRGVHGFTSGSAERAIAEKYRSQADAVELANFHRLAMTLRELATSYERDAERQASRDPFED